MGQPANLAGCGDSILSSLDAAPPLAPAELMLFTGMGASHFAALPAAVALRQVGLRAFAVQADELAGGADAAASSCLVALSYTGRSRETLDALAAHRGPTLAITNDESSPLAEAADVHLPLGSAPDPFISVQTYSGSVVAAALVAAEVGGWDIRGATAELPALATAALEQSEAVCSRVAERCAGAQWLDLVADGASVATAGAGALLFREACRRPAAWSSLRGYLHGPMEAAGEGSAHVVIGAGRAVELARDLVAHGAHVLLVTTDHVSAHHGLEVVRIPALHPVLSPVLEILPVQLLVAELCDLWEMHPASFRYPQDDTRTAQA